MRILKGTVKHGIRYTEQEFKLISLSDTDFANDSNRKSITEFVTEHAGGVPIILLGNCKQVTISLSTAEAEYIAATAIKELLWIQVAFGIKNHQKRTNYVGNIYVDNKNVIHLIKNDDGAASKRTKHIDIKFYFIREKQRENIAVDTFHQNIIQPNVTSRSWYLYQSFAKDRFKGHYWGTQ